MKKFLVFVCALSTVFCCVVPAFAAPDDPADEEEAPIIETVETAAGQTVSVTMSPVMGEKQSNSVAVYNADDPAAPSVGSLPALIGRVFGTYSPRTQTVTVYLDDGTTVESIEVIPGVAGMDWYWLAGVGLFSLVLLSFFRFLGVIFKHG